jgi:Zn-dependent protease
MAMNKRTISIGRIFGIPIGLDESWFLVFVFYTWILAVSFYPAEFKNWPAAEYWIMGALTSVLLFGCVVLHEVGHSLVAQRFNIKVRGITLFIFGGVSQIEGEPASAKAEFWISIAGPLVSFGLAIFFWLLQPVVSNATSLLAMFKYLALTNGVLALFNLIPGYPLDGGRIFRAVVWRITNSMQRATIVAAEVGRFIGFLFILFGVWQTFRGDFIDGLWIAFIGWFLESTALSQLQQQTVHDMLAGHKVSEAMRQGYASVRDDDSLQHVIDEQILGHSQRCFIVERENNAIGLLTLHKVKEVPRGEWATTKVGQVMIPMKDVKCVRSDSELSGALEEIDRDGVNQLPVMDNGHCVGMLRRDDVISILRTRRELSHAG